MTASQAPVPNTSRAVTPSKSVTKSTSVSDNGASSINQLGTTAGSQSTLATSAVVGVAIGCTAGVAIFLALAIYAVRSLKRRQVGEHNQLQPSSKPGDGSSKKSSRPRPPLTPFDAHDLSHDDGTTSATDADKSTPISITQSHSKQNSNATLVTSLGPTQATSTAVTLRKSAFTKMTSQLYRDPLAQEQASEEQTARLLDGDVSETAVDTCVIEVEQSMPRDPSLQLAAATIATPALKRQDKSAVSAAMSPPTRLGRKHSSRNLKLDVQHSDRGVSVLRERESTQAMQHPRTDKPFRSNSSSLNEQLHLRSRSVPSAKVASSPELSVDAGRTAKLLNQLEAHLEAHPAYDKATQALIKRIMQSLV